MNERPFFVVGCPRSGTTLVRTILDGHSRLSIPPESHFVIGLSRRGRRGTATIDDILAHPEFAAWDVDEAALRSAVEQRGPATYRELVSAVFEWYAESRGKERWGDKTPGYVGYLGPLLRVFPDAQFVHVIRDGREVTASLFEQAWGPKRPVVGAFWWRRRVAAGRRDGARLRPDQYLELRLDELIADPEGKVGELCAFLGEEFEPDMLDFPARARTLFAPDDTVTARVREPLAAGVRDWRAGVAPREQRAIEALCHRQLARLGYDPGRWSPAAAAYGWTAVLAHSVRRAPAAVRIRLHPERRSY